MLLKSLAVTLLLSISTLTTLAAETLDDKQFQKLMKEVGDANKRFKAGIDNQDSAQVGKDAARISEIYKQMAAFWRARKSDKAVKWSEDSSIAAASAATAAKTKDWDKVKLHLQDVTKNCKSCHELHREKLEDGSYRIK
jgi:cytochrome c556